MSLNTFLTFFWHFICFFGSKVHFEVVGSIKRAYRSPFSPKKKMNKKCDFHDYFKLLLSLFRWSFNNVEIFFRSVEGILNFRINVLFTLLCHQTSTFSDKDNILWIVSQQNIFLSQELISMVPLIETLFLIFQIFQILKFFVKGSHRNEKSLWVLPSFWKFLDEGGSLIHSCEY